MTHWNPFNFLLFALLGAAVLWAVRLVYEARRAPSDDVLKQVLLLAGWILVIAGVLGACISAANVLALIPVVGLIFAAFSYRRYVMAERRSLLWSMAVAAEHGIPLEQSARAYAEERSVQVGTGVAKLADLLKSGVPLPDALALSRNPLPADALLAARLGAETGQMGVALRMSVDHSNRFDAILRQILSKYVYLTVLLSVGTAVTTFIMLKIVPVFTKMFEEFGLELPWLTKLVISMSNFVVKLGGFGFLLYPILTLTMFLAMTYYVGLTRYEFPWVHRFWLRVDRALIMRALALTVRLQHEMSTSVAMLARQYPGPGVAIRLERAAEKIARGINWTDSLRSVRLLGRSDVAVLKSAEKAGNLAWALEEMSDSALRRHAYYLRFVLSLLFPVLLVAFGFTVGLGVVALMMPLVSMIQGLS